MSATLDHTATAEALRSWERFLAALRRARARAAQDPEARLSLPQYLLVAPLLYAPGLSVRALATAAGIASPTATRMLDGLEHDGIVRRAPSEHDRRSVQLHLTDAGRPVVADERARLEGKRAALFGALEPEERAHAARLLGRLAELMEEV
jgi:MarR family transcriptional regulator, organic hydroperoxide resistance regulator